MPRQPLIDERVVGGQQIQNIAVFMDDALKLQLGLAPHRLPQIIVEVREQIRIRQHARDVA